jgi:hypothetical protein
MQINKPDVNEDRAALDNAAIGRAHDTAAVEET